MTADLKQIDACHRAVEGADAILNMAADMGGMGFMESDIHESINLGSGELVSIHQLVDIVESFAGIQLERNYDLNPPRGVNGRNSDNTMIKARLGWEPSTQLREGLRKTYDWIESQGEDLTCV